MKTYEQFDFGNTGLKSASMGIGTAYGIKAKDMVWAFEQGINYWFWGSLRRRNVPKALKILGKSNREKVIIASSSYTHNAVASPLLIRLTVERILRDLRTEYLDIFQLGWLKGQPSEKIIRCLEKLKNNGLVRNIGLSTHNRKIAAELLGNPLFNVFMIRYNAAHRGAEDEIFPFTDKQKNALVSFTATRWGHLLSAPKGWAEDGYVPTASDCYRFVLSRPEISVCLTGAKNRHELEQNLKALDSQPLPGNIIARLKEFGDYVRANKFALMDYKKNK